ncbi:MAG: hypothetical protein IPK53_07795 [bacterium]|nr:hypothetical protein [bacterium]
MCLLEGTRGVRSRFEEGYSLPEKLGTVKRMALAGEQWRVERVIGVGKSPCGIPWWRPPPQGSWLRFAAAGQKMHMPAGDLG